MVSEDKQQILDIKVKYEDTIYGIIRYKEKIDQLKQSIKDFAATGKRQDHHDKRNEGADGSHQRNHQDTSTTCAPCGKGSRTTCAQKRTGKEGSLEAAACPAFQCHQRLTMG